MSRPTPRYFVNAKTRMCQILQGPEGGDLHQRDVAEAQACGFVEVDEEGLDAFRAETFATIEAGWNPTGRTSYKKFIEKQGKP